MREIERGIAKPPRGLETLDAHRTRLPLLDHLVTLDHSLLEVVEERIVVVVEHIGEADLDTVAEEDKAVVESKPVEVVEVDCYSKG